MKLSPANGTALAVISPTIPVVAAASSARRRTRIRPHRAEVVMEASKSVISIRDPAIGIVASAISQTLHRATTASNATLRIRIRQTTGIVRVVNSPTLSHAGAASSARPRTRTAVEMAAAVAVVEALETVVAVAVEAVVDVAAVVAVLAVVVAGDEAVEGASVVTEVLMAEQRHKTNGLSCLMISHLC
uniref:Uncharacterized protein n=1 Tax=Anopheles darlingi TaxID=43151 RepID=A0A2M4DT55_ANODA